MSAVAPAAAGEAEAAEAARAGTPDGLIRRDGLWALAESGIFARAERAKFDARGNETEWVMTIQAAQDGTWLEAAEEAGAVVVLVVVVDVGRCPPRGPLHLPYMATRSLYGRCSVTSRSARPSRASRCAAARPTAPPSPFGTPPYLATTCLIWKVRDRTIRWAYGAASAELGAEHASSLVTVLEKVIR